MLACHISIEYDAQGPSNSLTTGCAASAQAIGEAFRIIERGDADAMLAGGAESKLDPLSWARFEMMGLLTRNGEPAQKCIRPFDAKRDGFLPGEAGAVLMLEELEHAQKRGAKIYGELVGFGASVNPCFVISKKVDPKAQEWAMEAALHDATLSKEKVDLIYAHGLGLPETDRLEAQAIQNLFGKKGGGIPVTSYKGSTGFVGAAAGGLGVAAALFALEHQLIPPILNYENRDPECDLNCVAKEAKKAKVETVLVNSFGYTGQNASLLIKKY
jgi:3-oxoacyl-[acyl-carrier-protein] synthase II